MSDGRNPINSFTGKTLGGAPLALSREPPPDLAPWFCWISIAAGDMAENHVVQCGTLGDHACLRILFGGTWVFEMDGGPRTLRPGPEGMTLYFGPQDRYSPVSMAGTFRAITMHFTAGATAQLGGPSAESMRNRIVDYDELVEHGHLSSRIPTSEPFDRWFDALEQEMRGFVSRVGPQMPDPLMTVFERECLAEPNFSVSEFAASHGISSRTLERKVMHSYGMSPKRVLRRARALDMAARLLGVTMPEDQPAMDLRYYDESHRIREIRHFFGMTPHELASGACPILRVNMEARQNRRLRSLEQIGPNDPRPWRDPVSEPGETRIGPA